MIAFFAQLFDGNVETATYFVEMLKILISLFGVFSVSLSILDFFENRH